MQLFDLSGRLAAVPSRLRILVSEPHTEPRRQAPHEGGERGDL